MLGFTGENVGFQCCRSIIFNYYVKQFVEMLALSSKLWLQGQNNDNKRSST